MLALEVGSLYMQWVITDLLGRECDGGRRKSTTITTDSQKVKTSVVFLMQLSNIAVDASTTQHLLKRLGCTVHPFVPSVSLQEKFSVFAYRVVRDSIKCSHFRCMLMVERAAI